jgi:protocatechuate 3,4-dioxygenase beta subunit
VTAVAPGAGRAIRSNVSPGGTEVEIFLIPGATISGVVRDESGQPVKGALVRVQPESFGPYMPPTERTDASGRFALGGLEAGNYLLVAREGPRPPAVQSVSVEARGESTVELTLREGGFLTGRLVDGAGRATAGRVRLSSVEGTALNMLLQNLVEAEAGADGRFVLGPVPPGELVVQASGPGYAPRDVETTLAGRTQATDLGDVVLDAGPSIRGVVQDRQGVGVAGASLQAFTRGPAPPAEAESDESGAFVLAGLPATGMVELQVYAPGYARMRQSFTVGSDNVVLTLDAGGTIAGLVVGKGGEPVGGATVRAAAEGGDRSDMGAFGRSGDGDGRFALHDVRPGRYVVDVRAAGYAPANQSGVRVTEGGTTDVGTLRLRSGGTLQGTVADSAGEPVSGATVRVESGSSFNPGQQTQTDAAGAFQIAGLPAGRVDVVAQHPAFAPARVSGVTIESEGRPAEAALVLTRGGRVEGIVRTRSGQPFTAGRVFVYPRRGPRGFDPRSAQPIREDGTFLVERVPAGPSTLSVQSSATGLGGPMSIAFQPVIEREIEVVDGETSVVDIQTREILVRGRVTRGGEPVAGLLVSFMSAVGGFTMYGATGMGQGPATAAAGPQPLNGVTREDGSYELLVMEPGQYRASRRAPDGMMSSPLMSQGKPMVEIPDVPSFVVDFTLGSARVSGVVAERDSGKPVARASVGFGGKAGFGAGISDGEGRFSFDVEPGEGKLRVRAEGFAFGERDLTVGEGGLEDLRLELSQGLEIHGRVLDAAGRPAADLQVAAQAESGPASAFGQVLPDGTFRLRGVVDGSYTVSAGSDRAGFGYQTGSWRAPPTCASRFIHLPLRVRVVDESGQPVPKAYARIERAGGAPPCSPVARAGPRIRRDSPSSSLPKASSRWSHNRRTGEGAPTSNAAAARRPRSRSRSRRARRRLRSRADRWSWRAGPDSRPLTAAG